MADDDDDEGGASVLVFRNRDGAPIAVPKEVVLENDRTYRACEMHLQGASWALIAAQESYLDAATAAADVKRYMAEAKALIGEYTRRELLELEVARLDALQMVVWPQAMKGHLPAVDRARDLIMSRVKVQQLDQPSQEEGTTGPRTVVISQDGKEFLAQLTDLVDP